MLDDISFGLGRKLPMILQTESAECCLACICMVAGFHGLERDLSQMRLRFPVSLKGSTLADLVRVASSLHLNARPVTVELNGLGNLRLPAIVHWDFNHFVVLKKVSGNVVTIHDPSFGIRTMSLAEVSKSFTGVAVELWPQASFVTEKAKPPSFRVRDMIGPVSGLGRSLGQIAFLALVIELFALLHPLLIQQVVDHVIISEDRDLLTLLAVAFVILALMSQVVSAVRQWALMYLSTTLSLQWRSNVFSHLLRLPLQYFEKRFLADIVSRFGSVDNIKRTLTTAFLEAILDGTMTVITLMMMFAYSARLAWVAVLFSVLYGATRVFVYGALRAASEKQLVSSAKHQGHFLETVRGIKAIKLFQRQTERQAVWMSLVVDHVNADVQVQKLQLVVRFLNGILFAVGNVVIITWGATEVLDGAFSVGAMVAFLAYKDQFETRVSALIDKFSELRMLQLDGQRLSDIVATEPEADCGRAGSGLDVTREASVSVSGLSFRYSSEEPLILDNVSFHIAAGESVAIVGPSGCGKTTLINTMLGILTPSSGTIHFGGVDMRQLGIKEVRATVATVLQDDVLFAGSIAENICFFDPKPDHQFIQECARMASVAHDIVAMPMAYNTRVGDMGTVLSGGQKQRILLARAFYKRPQILFLDEATSHLDADREQEVNMAVRALNITRIIVAHRKETIATADRVITVSHGRVMEA